MKTTSLNSLITITLFVMGIGLLTECQSGANTNEALLARIDSLQTELNKIAEEKATIQKNLKTFDELDFEVFSGQQWERLSESHGQDIIVHWPDGHTTAGIDVHTDDLKAMFVYAPDTKIEQHPIRIGMGNMTAVMGFMTGTFSNPMPTGDGNFIEPTGKSFNLPMATIGIWNEEGVMTEEFLFWDNQAFMKQIGFAN